MKNDVVIGGVNMSSEAAQWVHETGSVPSDDLLACTGGEETLRVVLSCLDGADPDRYPAIVSYLEALKGAL